MKISNIRSSRWSIGFLIVIAAFVIIGAMSSCITEKKRDKICASCPVVTEVKTVIKDSVWTKEVVKYDTSYISVPGPTVVIPGPCDKLCDKNGKLKPFYSESTYNGIKTTIKADTTKNELILDCKEDSLMIVNEEKTIEINHLKSQLTEVNKTKEVKINELTWYQKFFIKTSYIFWLIIIIFTGYKIFRIYTKIKP